MLLRAHRWALDRWWVPPVLALVSVAVAWWLADRLFAIAMTVVACVAWAGTLRLLWERWRFRRLQRQLTEAERAFFRLKVAQAWRQWAEEAHRGAPD